MISLTLPHNYFPMLKKNTKNIRISRLSVTENAQLLDFLISAIKDKNRTKLKGMLARKQFMVNNTITKQFNFELKKGDVVKVSWDKPFREMSYQGVTIIFEDEDIIVVDKKSGLLSISSGNPKVQTVYKTIKHHVQLDDPLAQVFVVHRLDKDTSGLMVLAKNKNSQIALQKTWDKTITKRKYLAVTEGTFVEDKGTIDTFLKENKVLVMFVTNNPKDAKKAVTHYEVIKKNEYFTLLEAFQETERKNQLRVHLKSLGHPIIGDKKYESKVNPIGRMAMHLKQLVFIHPTTKKEVSFETKVPDDYLKLFRTKYYEG